MLYITEEQTSKAVSVESALPILRRAYLQCTEERFVAGPRLVMDLDQSGNKGQWLTANAATEGFFGSKFSAVFPKNPSAGKPATISTISLYSSETGELVALVAANILTSIKTAASAAIATDLLARKDASRLCIIGTGLQAFDQALAIRQVRDVREVIVFDLDHKRAEKFVASLEAVEGWDIKTTVAQSADAAVAEADIVCTCTTSRKPVFNGSALKPGTHINAIGSYSPDMQEIDCETVMRAGCVTTEHVDGLWAAAGDLIIPREKGLIDESKVNGSVGDLLKGTISGRVGDSTVTFYESVGSAVLDLAIAIETYRKVATKSSI